MPEIAKPKPHVNEARRHFLGLAAAAGARVSAVGLAISSFPFSANANNGVGWGVGGTPPGNGQSPKCFLRGTRIATSHGERAIEDLEMGDDVTTLEGASAMVKWIARQTYERNAEGWPESVAPIRIRRDALGDATPARDLYLSPAHRLFIDGYLIEARDLVNGVSILQEDPQTDRVAYFHVLLESHDILLAEGAPAASMQLGVDGHKSFANAMEYERLYGRPQVQMKPYAQTLGVGGKEHLAALLRIGASPFVQVRDPLREIRARLAARSEELCAL
jgi:hypothetical protein